MYYSDYEATYGRGSYWLDYKTLYFLDFLSKMGNIQGRFQKIIEYRTLALEGTKTKFNKSEFDLGLELLTDKQKRYKSVKRQNAMVDTHKMLQEQIDNMQMKKYSQKGV